MKKIFSLLVILTVCSICALAQSRILTDTVYSNVLGAKRAYTVYLPPSFGKDQTRTYPVLYLLHGLWGCNEDWAKMSQLKGIADKLIRSGEAEEMIIVTPDADEGSGKDMQCGYFNMPGWAYEDFFFGEFIPYIEKTYRGIGDKKHRAIAGLSMGGGGTTGYAQHHPEMFAAAYPMSALMQPSRVIRSKKANDKYAILQNSVVENDHVKFVENADDPTCEALRSVEWMVDCGDDDSLLDGNTAFHQAMRAKGIPCELRVRDGVHDWVFWNSALYTCLPFVSRSFR